MTAPSTQSPPDGEHNTATETTEIPVTSGTVVPDTSPQSETAELDEIPPEAAAVISHLETTTAAVRIPNTISPLSVTVYYADYCIRNNHYFLRLHCPPIGTSRWIVERKRRHGDAERRLINHITSGGNFDIITLDAPVLDQ